MGNYYSATSSKKDPQEESVEKESKVLDEGEVKDNINSCSAPSINSNDGSCSDLQLEAGSASDLAMALSEADETYFAELTEAEEDGEGEYSGGESVMNETESLALSIDDDSPIKLKVFSSSDIRIENLIGEGEFGKVSKAILQGKHRIPVAVKGYNAPFDGDTFARLTTVIKLRHRNVVTIVGVLDSPNNQFDQGSGPKVILHYYPEGNLLQYLSRPHSPQDYATLVKLALDVVQGCEYLHSKNIIHGNLAARNILVEKQRGRMMTHYNAKVSDHGMIQLAKAKGSGHFYHHVYNGKVLPIRWVPKELLIDEGSMGFTYASDVWSFGIIVWEILTKGSVPYGRRKEEEKVIELIKAGQSPLNIRIPQGYPQEIIDVMKLVFKEIPCERPTFCELRKELLSISGSMKLQSKLESQCSLAMYASGLDGSRRRRESGAARRKRSRDAALRSVNSFRSLISGGAPEKVNLLKSNDKNQDINPLLKLSESKDGDIPKDSRIMDRNPVPMKPLGQGNSHLGPRNRHESGNSSSAPVLAFPALNTQSNDDQSVVVPPPAYSRYPPAYHGTVEGSGTSRQPPHQNGRREATRPPRDRRAPRRRPRHEGRVDYSKEIKKKEQELESLRLRKLQHEASETLDKMQCIVSQLTQLRTGPPRGPSVGRRGSAEMRHQYDSYERSRVPGRGSRRGHSRSRSRGTMGEEAVKLTTAPSPAGASYQENVF